ncbi:MAG: ABC transporter permease [Acidobacteriota bacterium]|nr:ABC transporter permease [Acidobacteriota bacterium]
MNALRVFFSRLREHMSRGRIDRDFQEELQSNLEMITDEHLRRGLSPDEARRAALVDIGGLERTRELVGERRGFKHMDNLSRDVRHALRVLRTSPGFAAVAVLTLALGIGANAAIFSFINAVILRPLPYPQPDRLVAIWEAENASGERGAAAPANIADYQTVSGFADVASYSTGSRSLTGGGLPEGHVVELVSHNYFDVLRVHPALGRAFTREEDSPVGRKVVIIGDALWQGRFSGDRRVLGRAIAIDGIPHEVVGVMPPGFRGLTSYGVRDGRQIWLPAAYPSELLANRGDHEVDLIGRLRDGADVAAARAELTAISESLAKAHPETNAEVRAGVQPLGDDLVRDVQRSLAALMLTVGLILAIACVNVANLLIARGVGRRREVAVRYALGATRTRVYTTLVTESVVLAMLASIAGLCLAIWLKGVLVSVAPASLPRLSDVALDTRVVLFTLVLSLITGIIFGGVPAWQAGQPNPIDAMSSGGRVVAGRKIMRWRNALMITQLALSALLLVGAGLMIKSLVKLNRVDLGFDTSGVIALRTNLPAAKYPTGVERLAFFTALEERVAALPGVSSVGFTNTLPLRGGWGSGFRIEGEPVPAGGSLSAGFQAVSPGYFQTLGIPLLRGRQIALSDVNDAQPVAIVSEAFERVFLNGGDALGRRFSRGPEAPMITVVGVIRDVRRDGRTEVLDPQVYLPASQTALYPVRLSELAVRSVSGDPHALVPALRSAVWSIDPDQPLTRVSTLEETLTAQSAERRFQTLLFAIFAALALVLASIGTYGVVAYLVSQRTPEIGLRLALGASRGRIYRWLLARTALLVVTGALAGVGIARLLARFLEALLFEVPAGDVATYVAAGVTLITVGLAACLLAARRAARVSPTVALRYE